MNNKPLYWGIDPSLTSTGIIGLDDNARIVHASHIGFRGEQNMGLIAQAKRISQITSAVANTIPSKTHVGIETPAYGSQSTSAWERGGLLYSLVMRLVSKDCHVYGIPPANAKTWLAGHAQAGKKSMMICAEQLSGHTFATDDEADAYAIARMTHEHVTGVSTGRRGLNKCDWGIDTATHIEK